MWIDVRTINHPRSYISPLLASYYYVPSIKPVKGEAWKRNDIWSGWHGEYRGSVTAHKGASLSGLAYMATRHAEDWRDLGVSENVEIGQVVEIAPILKKFEMRVRASVIAATKQFKATGFPPADG